MRLERLLLTLFVLCEFSRAAETGAPVTRVEIGERAIRRLDPCHALGGGIDGHWQGETMDMLEPESVRKMLGAGLGPVSVRLRTELAVEAWHWNPKGRWSDPVYRQGYWTSEARPDPEAPILLSYGYKLPRRGTTRDEANDDGYSMLDDGDRSTFWKSNPYLTSAYTGEPDDHYPQWVVIDFGKPVPINAISILWGEPYASSFRVEYATSGRVYFGGHPWNVWHTFPRGVVTSGKGGEQFLKFGERPRMARYLRIWMTASSGTAPKGSEDPRDGMGYAIREMMAGEAGQFDSRTLTSLDDHVIHSPDRKQTLTYASSTDPWHRESDRDSKVEQPGIDRIFRSGITRGLPAMLSIPVFYDTPENGAAFAEYVKRSGYRVGRWELGEEPDGQRVDPRDFGALYAESAQTIRKKIPDATMGGPSFVTADVQPNDETYRFDKGWWIRSFQTELKRRGQEGDLQFLSFEWYPFDDVTTPAARLLPKAFGMMDRTMKRLRGFGLPLVIGEFNYSVFPCQQEVDLSGALLNAEVAAQFLCGGGDAAYFYSYEPNNLAQTCGSWGNQIMLLKNESGAVPVAAFHAMRLLNGEWMDPKGGAHDVLPVRLQGGEAASLSAFALRRPNGKVSLLVINKADYPVTVAVHGMRLSVMNVYGSGQYRWLEVGRNGHPIRNLPPATSSCVRGSVRLPAFSLAVIR
jgi:hypothetical protein